MFVQTILTRLMKEFNENKNINGKLLSDMANVLVVVGALAEKIGLKYTFSKTKKKSGKYKKYFCFFLCSRFR